MRLGGTRVAATLAVLLLAAPMGTALSVATRSIKARPSAEYSPQTAWEQGYHGCGITIAVLDEGVDDEHPYLEGNVLAGKDTTVTEPAWKQANDGNPQPIRGDHGTPVAGIALSNAGETFSSEQEVPDYAPGALVGVAPCARLVDVQFNDLGLTPIDTFTENVLQAYEWVLEHEDDDWDDDDPANDGIDIVTMSWSPNDDTNGSDPICRAATEAVEAGIVVLGSAGNSGRQEEPDLGCPTGADGAISVANLDNRRTVERSDDALRDTSTWGPRKDDGDDDPYEELKPDIAAPGHDVISTGSSLADGREYQLACLGSCRESFGGTSAATPMAAGVVALAIEANPDLAPADVKTILHQTAQPHPEMERSASNLSATWDHRYGYGMVDAFKAVRMAEMWPGQDLGIDRDADGLRDVVDAGPTDPDNRTLDVPDDLKPVGGAIDTDGDFVPDADDPAPLDPRFPDG